jgi:tetratricopeptide (TPR) repeat protein
MGQHRFLQADADLQACIKYWSDDPELRFQSARAVRRAALMGLFTPNWEAQVAQQLRECERLDYPPEDIDLERMLLTVMRGNLGSVETRLLALVTEEHPDTSLILETLTPAYLAQFQVPRASLCASELVAREPNFAYAYYWRGAARELLLANEKAIEDYRRALEIDAEFGEARQRLANLLLVAQHYEEGGEQLRQLLKQRPNDPDLLLGWARACHGQGELNRPQIILDQLLNKSPDNAMALEERGRLAMERAELDDAVKYLSRALRIAPQLAQANYSLYQCLGKLGRAQEAAEYGKRFQQMDADNQHFRKVAELLRGNPQSADLRAEAGTLLLRNDQKVQAVGWLRSCLQLDPYHPVAHLGMAKYYEELKQRDRAAFHRRSAAQGLSMPGRLSIPIL